MSDYIRIIIAMQSGEIEDTGGYIWHSYGYCRGGGVCCNRLFCRVRSVFVLINLLRLECDAGSAVAVAAAAALPALFMQSMQKQNEKYNKKNPHEVVEQ